MSPLAVRRAPLWFVLRAGFVSIACTGTPSAPAPGAKLTDGVQKKLALLP